MMKKILVSAFGSCRFQRASLCRHCCPWLLCRARCQDPCMRRQRQEAGWQDARWMLAPKPMTAKPMPKRPWPILKASAAAARANGAMARCGLLC